MSNDAVRSSRAGVDLFWAAFWLTILVLLGFYIYAQIFVERNKLIAGVDGKPAILIEYKKEFAPHIPEIIAEQAMVFVATRKEVEASIDNRIDKAFEPVYAQIPKLANFHYSIVGEYTEIVAAISGNLAKDMTKILFDEVRLEERLDKASAGSYSDALGIIAPALKKVRSKIQQKLQLTEADLSLLSKEMEFTIEDIELRFNTPISALQRGGVAAGFVVSAKGVSILSTKVAVKVATKAALKAGVKGTSILGGAVTGGVACSWAGPLGSVVCGVGGALLAWVVTDAIVVKVDEHINRDDFEKNVRSLIDDQRATVKKAVKERWGKLIQAVEKSNKKTLKRLPEGKTPAEMMRSSDRSVRSK